MIYIHSFSLLYLSTDRSLIRAQDEVSVISDVASNVAGRNIAFDFINENWDELLEKLKLIFIFFYTKNKENP